MELKNEAFKNFDTMSLLNSIEPEEKQKMFMNTLSKYFVVDNASNSNIQINFEYLDRLRKFHELKERKENFEIENKNILQTNMEKENAYTEKISRLEKQVLHSDKADIWMLQKQNANYENQILNLKKLIQITKDKNSQENEKFKSTIGDLMIVRDQLKSEIEEIQNLKKEIKSLQSEKKDQLQSRNPNKVKLVMRYSKAEEVKRDSKPEESLMSKYKIKKSSSDSLLQEILK
jgi:hypothetical protein